MSLYDEFVKKLIWNVNNKVKLDYGEDYIFIKYNNHIKNNIFEIPNTHIIFENIKQELLQTKMYIVKLIFSNGKCIHIPIRLLLLIEYFKIMLEGYNFENECIINIIMDKNVDDYAIINSIISFTVDDIYDMTPLNCTNMYKTIIMLDYIGEMEKMMDKVINVGLLATNDIEDCNDYENYKDNNVDKNILNVENMEKFYNVLKQNKIKNCDMIISRMVSNMDDVNIKDTTVFSEVVIYTDYGKRFIEEHNLFTYYAQIFSVYNYKNIIENLLKQNTEECWNIIVAIMNKSNNNNIIINKWLFKKFDMITELIFNHDITIFDTIIQLKLLIKFNKLDIIDMVGDKVVNIGRYAKHNVMDIFANYLESQNAGDGNKFKNTKGLSPKLHYKNYGDLSQVISYTPFICKQWHLIGYLNRITINDNMVCIIIRIKMPKGQVINKDTLLMINKYEGNKYNIIKIDHILLPYYNANGMTQYEPIGTIYSNIDDLKLPYGIVYDTHVNKDININMDDYVFIQKN